MIIVIIMKKEKLEKKESLYSGYCGPIVCYRWRRRLFGLCGRGMTPVSSWRPYAVQDRPSPRRPTSARVQRPVEQYRVNI